MLLALSAWYLWGGLFGLLWFICLVSAGVLTWKNGHKILFFIGFILPLLWIVGAVMSKKPAPYQPARAVQATTTMNKRVTTAVLARTIPIQPLTNC